jgi:hypothetical protein
MTHTISLSTSSWPMRPWRRRKIPAGPRFLTTLNAITRNPLRNNCLELSPSNQDIGL